MLDTHISRYESSEIDDLYFLKLWNRLPLEGIISYQFARCKPSESPVDKYNATGKRAWCSGHATIARHEFFFTDSSEIMEANSYLILTDLRLIKKTIARSPALFLADIGTSGLPIAKRLVSPSIHDRLSRLRRCCNRPRARLWSAASFFARRVWSSCGYVACSSLPRWQRPRWILVRRRLAGDSHRVPHSQSYLQGYRICQMINYISNDSYLIEIIFFDSTKS